LQLREVKIETYSAIDGADAIAIVIDIARTKEVLATRIDILVKIIAVATTPIAATKDRLYKKIYI